MTIEYARQKGLKATSEEFELEGEEIIGIMPGKDGKKGGTMRLGEYTAEIKGQVKRIYGEDQISERHRHRYEFKPKYYERLEDQNFRITGENPESGLAEFIELKNHPLYIGTQAHPEFRSKVENPSPLFERFIQKSMESK
jgi:CTP synthase